MKKPTAKQITDEIAKLENFKSRLSTKRSSFGDDHEQAIEAEIDVLSNRMSEALTYDTYEDSDESVQSAAAAAARWLTGDEDDAPSKNWAESSHLFRAA